MGYSAGSNLLLQNACSKESERLNYLNFLCLWPYSRTAESYKILHKGVDVILFATAGDKIAPAEFSAEIATQFKDAGNEAKFINHPQGNHSAYNFYGAGPTVDWTEEFLAWMEVKGLLKQDL